MPGGDHTNNLPEYLFNIIASKRTVKWLTTLEILNSTTDNECPHRVEMR
jgi:hypothetical protein